MKKVVVFALGNSVFKEVVPGVGLRIQAIRKVREKYPNAKILSVF